MKKVPAHASAVCLHSTLTLLTRKHCLTLTKKGENATNRGPTYFSFFVE